MLTLWQLLEIFCRDDILDANQASVWCISVAHNTLQHTDDLVRAVVMGLNLARHGVNVAAMEIR